MATRSFPDGYVSWGKTTGRMFRSNHRCVNTLLIIVGKCGTDVKEGTKTLKKNLTTNAPRAANLLSAHNVQWH